MDKCANCKYRLTDKIDEGHCKGCNSENNSINWVYEGCDT